MEPTDLFEGVKIAIFGELLLSQSTIYHAETAPCPKFLTRVGRAYWIHFSKNINPSTEFGRPSII